jgi:DNA mismatch repair protein MutS2
LKVNFSNAILLSRWQTIVNMVLSMLPGVGERLAKKITDHFGSEQLALDHLKAGDIGRIAEVEGVSPKRALALARSIAGDNGQFLATKEAVKLHQKLLAQISGFAACSATRERMQLLTPINNIDSRRERVNSALDFLNKHSNVESILQASFRSLGATRNTIERYERVVVTHEPRDNLKRYCRVLIPGEKETWKDYTVFKTVTWIGSGAPKDTPDGWIVLGSSPSEEIIVPEKTLDWFKNNKRVLGCLANTVSLLNTNTEEHPFFNLLENAVEGLSQLPELLESLSDEGDAAKAEHVKDNLWPFTKNLQTQVNQRVEKAMNDAKLALSGAELLEALSDGTGFQRKLKEVTGQVIDEAMQEAVNQFAEFLEGTGIRCPPILFNNDWPAKVDRQVIDKVDSALEDRLKAQHADHIYTMARKLGPLKSSCEEAIRKLIECEQWLAIGRWSNHFGCTMPEIVSHGIWVENGRHIMLGIKADPVTYGIGFAAEKQDQQSLALLTGANSGGKTTLLELLAHTCILAHMGLPVPADRARVGGVESLHILAKAGGTQSAGALEQTLVELADVVSDPTPKLILADELEAITEPGAGARIIAGMLLAARSQPDTCMMLVTHLAPAIIEASECLDLRVDGIEASGLDADLELIVDRTPKRNHLARSTPELIVKRLVERSNGHAKALFGDILKMF